MRKCVMLFPYLHNSKPFEKVHKLSNINIQKHLHKGVPSSNQDILKILIGFQVSVENMVHFLKKYCPQTHSFIRNVLHYIYLAINSEESP